MSPSYTLNTKLSIALLLQGEAVVCASYMLVLNSKRMCEGIKGHMFILNNTLTHFTMIENVTHFYAFNLKSNSRPL